jgi:hypothetical protein
MKRTTQTAAAWAAALLVTLVAGHVGPSAGAQGQAFDVEFDADLSNCVDNVFVRLDSFERINGFLPPGFAARDASAAAGEPAPLGMGLLAGVSFECEWSEVDGGPVDTSWVFTVVETPEVEGLELEQGVPPTGGEPWLDLYLFGYYTSARVTARALRHAGFHAVRAETAVDFSATNTTARSTISDSRGEVAEVEVAGAVPNDKQPNVRFWHQSDKGLSYFQWNRSPYRQFTGEITACALRPDSILAQVFGVTDCSGLASPSSAIGVVVPNPSNFDGFFRFMPGVEAAPVR